MSLALRTAGSSGAEEDKDLTQPMYGSTSKENSHNEDTFSEPEVTGHHDVSTSTPPRPYTPDRVSLPGFSPSRYPGGEINYALDDFDDISPAQHGGPHARLRDVYPQQPTSHLSRPSHSALPSHPDPLPPLSTKDPKLVRLRGKIDRLKAKCKARRKRDKKFRQKIRARVRQLDYKVERLVKSIRKKVRNIKRARLQGDPDVLRTVKEEHRGEQSEEKQWVKPRVEVLGEIKVAQQKPRKSPPADYILDWPNIPPNPDKVSNATGHSDSTSEEPHGYPAVAHGGCRGEQGIRKMRMMVKRMMKKAIKKKTRGPGASSSTRNSPKATRFNFVPKFRRGLKK